MCRGPKTEQPHPLPVLNSRHSETAKTDDAGAQKRCSMQVIQRVGKGKHKASLGHSIIGISAVHGVTGESGRIAEVFSAVLAIPARPVNPANPGNSNPRPQGGSRRRAFYDLTYDLMARNQLFPAGWKLAFGNVQVGPADATGSYPQEDLPRLGERSGNLANPKRVSENILG
jgi:hypothetical protein